MVCHLPDESCDQKNCDSDSGDMFLICYVMSRLTLIRMGFLGVWFAVVVVAVVGQNYLLSKTC